jgi:hypothetical protein
LYLSYKVGAKGQIVIDQEIREALGVQTGWVASQRLVQDHVEIRFFPPEHDQSLAGVLADYVKRSVSQADWGATRDRAWAEAAAEKEAGMMEREQRSPRRPSKKSARRG